MAEETRKRPGMVDWYAPVELIQTGIRTLASTMLGEMIDSRRLFGLEGAAEDAVVDYSSRESFTFDYIADTGDGWDATYTMAYLLTSPRLEVEGETEPLERADAVILGGDQVYPVASKEAYARRLSSPFRQAARDIREALKAAGESARLPRRDLFQIPGNHDWYDSLGSMSRRFFAVRVDDELKSRKLGQFDTRQVRSYFVLKLPHDWEVWAVDVQLGRDIDPGQFAFFGRHAKTVGPQTKIVLACAEPTIVYGESAELSKPSLIFGLNRIQRLAYNRGARVLVNLAGDTHNYQRYEIERTTRDDVPYRRTHLVSGGGGAFLHPNHSFNKGDTSSIHKGEKSSPRIEPLGRYPKKETSQRLARRIFGFAAMHRGMAVLIGALYLVLFAASGTRFRLATFPLEHPFATLLAIVVVAGCAVFAGKGHRLWGAAHGVGHFALAFFSHWASARLVRELLEIWSPPEVVVAYLPVLLVFLIGAVLGASWFGLYLWISLTWRRIHHNEAFSSLSNPHYKHLLRFTVGADGEMTVGVIGVERTAGQGEGHPVATHLVEKIPVPPPHAAV